MVVFNTLNLPTLISRKIWVTEKLCDNHTVFGMVLTPCTYDDIKLLSRSNDVERNHVKVEKAWSIWNSFTRLKILPVLLSKEEPDW